MPLPSLRSPASGQRVRPGQTGRRAERALAELLAIETLGTIEDREIVLEEFQRGFVMCRGRFRCVEKARQVGFSWIFAAESVARCHLRDTHTATFISYNLGDAVEKVKFAREIASALPRGFRKQATEDAKTHVSFRDPATGRDSRIMSHPSRAPRGRGGDVYLDELAHYQNDEEVYKGTTALIARHPRAQLTVCSTPAGRRGVFWEIARQETEKRYPGYFRQAVPWWLSRFYCRDPKKAQAAGIVQLATHTRVEQWGFPAIVEQFDAMHIEDFQQEYECVPTGAIIVTAVGPKRVEIIERGDRLLTHTGDFQPVVETSERCHEGDLVSLTTYHSRLPLEVTPNHPVLMLRDPCRGNARRVSPSTCRGLPEPRFVPAREIRKHDILVYPVPRANADVTPASLRVRDHFRYPRGYKSKNRIPPEIPINDAMLRLAGYYIAEGSVVSSGRSTAFAFHKNERHLVGQVRADVQKVFGLVCSERTQGRCTTISVNSVVVAAILRSVCGHGAHEKHIPSAWMHLPVERLRILVDAYLDGDGHRRPGLVTCSTVSLRLVFQVRDYFVRAGSVATLRQNVRPAGHDTIEGRVVRTRAVHEVRVHPKMTMSGKGRRGWNDGRYVYLPVRSATKRRYVGKVYNFTVARDHSYVVGSHAVHNCAYIDEAHAFYPWKLLIAQSRDLRLEEGFNNWTTRGRLTAGYDVGRRRDLSALCIVEEIDGHVFPRFLRTWDRKPFPEQHANLIEMMDALPIARLAIDEQGIGMQLAEELAGRYPGLVEPAKFTLQSKEMWAGDVKVLLEKRDLTLPKHRDLLTQMHGIRRVVIGGKPRFDSEGNAGNHGDLYWALALAAYRERTHQPARVVVRARVI